MLNSPNLEKLCSEGFVLVIKSYILFLFSYLFSVFYLFIPVTIAIAIFLFSSYFWVSILLGWVHFKKKMNEFLKNV